VTYVDTRSNVWEALAGRTPGEPSGPADPGLWGAVVDRLNPARARPVLRAGLEAVRLTGVRGAEYVMVRSPEDGTPPGYLRLSNEEWELTLLMDGEHTVTRLVAEFARIAGRLAPDQVRRVVADLAGHRMLEELPMDAFRPLEESRHKPLPERVGDSVLAAARGRRALVFNVDGLAAALYRAGGRLFFGKAATIVTAVLAVAGLALFLTTWARGSRALFLAGDSYLVGAIVLVVLNGLVVGAHELSRALAVKHAGREVPAGGLLVWFGIPSLFVDTSDVWMAGRRARLLVAAAGPLSALLLAGLAQGVGLALPAVAGLAFKFAFLCYLNAFFQLSPLLPGDGHYLLMDWLEIPRLRARGLSWAGGRLRGRGPRWSTLDREGRLIGLYGILAVVWLAVAANVAFRIWTDRIEGVATGLWHAGLLGVLLLLLIVLGLGGPALGFVAARIGTGWRRSRQRRSENDREADNPRRLAALQASDLGGLPEPALNGLAARARWVHPSPGRQLIEAGGAQAAVFVVVDGALAARKPGDPTGTIRHQVGPGGVVGLVNALAGRSTQLDWHTAGTTLLSLPVATVATVIGPLPGPPPQDRAEAEALFADTPALTGLAVDQRLALIASAHPVDLDPGAPVILPGPTHAVVVESGVIALPDGVELRRGTLVGPVGDGSPGVVAQTRTPVRLWVLPDASDIPPLVGATHRPGSPMPVVSLKNGLRPAAPKTYPPLAVPPGPPDELDDSGIDKRFERGLWWLVVALLVVALAMTAISFRPGPAWAEMPTAHALLAVEQGRITALLDDGTTSLEAGDRRYVDVGSTLTVPEGSNARLTFPGGAVVVLCGGSKLEVGRLHTEGGRRQQPHATLSLQNGRMLADTKNASGAFQPLALTVGRTESDVVSSGAAWFAADTDAVTVANGDVRAGDAAVPATAQKLSCGDGVPVSPPSAGEESGTTEEPFPSDPVSIPPSVPATVPTTAATTTTAPVPRETPTPDPGDNDDDDDDGPADPPGTTTNPTFRPPTIRPTTTRPPPRPTTTPPKTTQPTVPPSPTPEESSTDTEASSSSSPQSSEARSSDAVLVLRRIG
jgi:putative peptide zinc metalloprotease protein